MIRLAIFASGTGTNTQAIIKFFRDDPNIQVSLIVASRSEAGAIQVAEHSGVESIVLSKEDFDDKELVLETLQAFDLDAIILAGWLLMIPGYLVQAFEGRMLNIHPALLPKYGGKGMYGRRVHEAVHANQESHSGITIHEVNEVYDDGRIFLQEQVELSPDDDPLAIEKKVRALELEHYPKAIKKFLESRLNVS